MGSPPDDSIPHNNRNRPRVSERISQYNLDYHDEIVDKLPKIPGVVYDRRLKCWKSVLPTSKKIVTYFSIKRYGFKESWLKALFFVYNFIIEFYMSKYPQSLTSELDPSENSINLDDKTSSDDEDTHSFRAKLYDRRRQETLNEQIQTNSPKFDGNYSQHLNGTNEFDATKTDDLEGYVKFIELINHNNPVVALKNGIERDTIPKPSRYSALLAASRRSSIKNKKNSVLRDDEGKDPKAIAKSLRPWHPHVFWIPSISRWRTIYYDALSVRHTKTFTPAVFGGVKAAYYAAVEFRTMIDSMEDMP